VNDRWSRLPVSPTGKYILPSLVNFTAYINYKEKLLKQSKHSLWGTTLFSSGFCVILVQVHATCSAHPILHNLIMLKFGDCQERVVLLLGGLASGWTLSLYTSGVYGLMVHIWFSCTSISSVFVSHCCYSAPSTADGGPFLCAVLLFNL
jgi:hypothetical protein